jgi:putative molybdopterin biosynthesis protein
MLSREGLVVAHRGAGTRVTSSALQGKPEPWRWASLINRAETFLLDVIGAGHTPSEAENALSVAIARWQELQSRGKPEPVQIHPESQLRFVGSHDLVVELLPRMLAVHSPAISLELKYVGSLGGLMALARDEADVAGVHLWDESSDSYNAPFVRRVLPGRVVVLLTLCYRSLGLIVEPGNPLRLHSLRDLAKPGVRFVNRQAGSGTRVWLDAQLKALHMAPSDIVGYADTERTHLGVARALAEGRAAAALGIQAAGAAYGLGFQPLTQERYDVVLPEEVWSTTAARQLVEVIRSAEFRDAVLALGGYDVAETGQEVWIR